MESAAMIAVGAVITIGAALTYYFINRRQRLIK